MVVDSGYEKRRKRKKPTKKLLVGEHVEVLFSDEGLRGSWHSGIVIDCGEYTRLVEYTNLVNEDNCSKLREWFPVSASIEGLPTKTQKYHRGHIRPSPSRYEIQEAEINYGLCVDALVDDAWWEGVVFDHAKGLKERLIFFPDQGDQQMVSMDRLRLTQEWNEVSGYWEPRGVWLLLQVLQPFEHEEELPVSVREIWFDLRTMATFPEEIGVWTFGSQSNWHIFVSELIQELRSVVRGLVPFEQQMDFSICYDTVDIPNEESPCLGGIDIQKNNAGENASLTVALNNPILLTLGDQSLLDSSSDERCADESLSHIATENTSTEGSRGGLRNSDTFSLHKSKNDYCGSKNLVLPIGKNCGSTTEASESEFKEAINCSRSNNRLARKNKGAVKASKPVDLEAAACCALLQGHQKRKQKHRKDKQTNAGCGEFVNTKSHQNSACFQQVGQEGLSRRSNCQRGDSSRPEKISNYKESRGFKDVKLSAERYRKSKRRKVISHTFLPSVTLGDRKVKHSSTKSSVCEKSKRRKECQALLRQGNELGNCLSPHVTEPRKMPQLSMLQTYSQCVARTVLSELLDNDIISLEADVSYIRKKDGKVLMEGQITRDGIKCKCCKMVYTPSNFEAHAGRTYGQPAASIFLHGSGKSLLECKMQMVQSKKPKDSRRCRMKVDCSKYKSDTVCTICHDGGNLVLCDHCLSSFHLECVGLESVPKGEWFCPSCRCGACGMSEFNSDTKQFTEKTILYCDQCEREYHVGCMRKRGDESLSSCPAGNWFCSEKCSEIFLHLRQLLGISKPTSVEGLSLTILRSGRENGVDDLQFDAATTIEHDSKLCVALNVLHDCFVTITEPRTQSDFVADILFNRESELRRLNFYGFYTILLEKGDELVSVATFRVYGDKVAEMPLVGTHVNYHNQGMCRLLVNGLEKLLSELGVECLVLPAAPQLLQTWTSSFGFSKITKFERLNLSEYTILYFHKTTMCRKLLKKRDPTVMSKRKGQFKKLMDISRSIKKGDSELYNSVSEADGTVEPINAMSSVHTDQFNQTGHQIDAEHSPLMAPSNIDPQILKKCYKRMDKDNSIRQQHTDKNVYLQFPEY